MEQGDPGCADRRRLGEDPALPTRLGQRSQRPRHMEAFLALLGLLDAPVAARRAGTLATPRPVMRSDSPSL